MLPLTKEKSIIENRPENKFETDDLAHGIEWVLNNENYDELCQNAREKVLREFDSVVVAKKYIELYNSILIHK